MAFYNYDLLEKIKSLGKSEYNRKSTTDREDKQMRSIEGQHEDILEDIYVPLKINPDDVILIQEKQSAFKEGRPKFQILIDEIETGKVQVVFVWHPNRIARNYADGGNFVQLMADGKLQYVITPHGIFENTPRDREYLMNEFTRATRDSDDKSVAVKRGNKIKLKDGYIPSGRLAEGFVHVKNNKEEFITTGDPARFPLIEKAIQLVLNQSHSPQEALAVLNDDWAYRTHKTKRTGDKPLSDSTWYKILNDPKYFYGEIQRSEGVFISGDEMPKPFTREDYEKVQIILGGKSARRRTKKDWAYTGLGIICGGCEGTVIMDEKWQVICSGCKNKFAKAKDRISCPECGTLIEDMQQPKILHYTWLYGNHKPLPDGSKCSQRSLAVKDFESQIDLLLSKFTIPKEFTDWAIKWLHKLHVVEVEDRTGIKENLQKLDSEVQKQIDDLLDLRLRRQITDEEYQHKKESLLDEQRHVRSRLSTTDKRADDWLELSEKTFNFATHARYWFANGTNQQKREILSAIGSNLILKDQKILLYQRKPFTIIGEMQNKIEILLDLFEPEDLLGNTSYSDTSNPVIPSLLPS